MQLAGRTVLVTGAAHRVGKAIAIALARAGARIAVHYRSSRDEANETIAALGAIGVESRGFAADLSDPKAPEQLIGDVVHHFGSLDVLVNSAAMMTRTPIGEVTIQEWDEMFALNLRAPFFVTQAAVPHLKAARGCVVNIADLAAFETWPAYVPHSITKAGIVQMTRGLAHALAPEIRVNAIAPGAVLLPDGWDAEAGEHLRTTTPLQRIGSPEDVAHTVRYLIEADYVTGETVIVDGGRHVRT